MSLMQLFCIILYKNVLIFDNTFKYCKSKETPS